MVLCFYPLAFTEVCSAEMRCVNSDFRRMDGQGHDGGGGLLRLFRRQQHWAEKEGYTQDLLCDMHREVCKAVGLFWADLNVSSRGTIVIPKSATAWPRRRLSRRARRARRWNGRTSCALSEGARPTGTTPDRTKGQARWEIACRPWARCGSKRRNRAIPSGSDAFTMNKGPRTSEAL